MNHKKHITRLSRRANQPTKLKKAIKLKRAPKGPLIDITYRYAELNFPVSTQETNKAEMIISPPSGCSDVIVTLAGFDLKYQDDDHHIARIHVDTGVAELGGGQIKLTAWASFHDQNYDDPWLGSVDLMVQFLIR